MADSQEERCDCPNCRRMSDREYKDAREELTVTLKARDWHSLLTMALACFENTEHSDIGLSFFTSVTAKIGRQTVGESPADVIASDEFNTVMMKALQDCGVAIIKRQLEMGGLDEEAVERLGKTIGEVEAKLEGMDS